MDTYENQLREKERGFPSLWNRENEKNALERPIEVEDDISSLEIVESIEKGDTILPVCFRVEGSDDFASEVTGKIKEIVNTELVKFTQEEAIAV